MNLCTYCKDASKGYFLLYRMCNFCLFFLFISVGDAMGNKKYFKEMIVIA